MEEGGGGEGGGGARDTESKTRTPHKDVGNNLPALPMGRDFSFQWQPPSQWSEMVRLGVGHLLKTLLFQPWKLKPLKNKYTLTTTKLGFLSRVLFNRGSHMFMNREGPTQSMIAKHFLECWC